MTAKRKQPQPDYHEPGLWDDVEVDDETIDLLRRLLGSGRTKSTDKKAS